MIKHHHFFTAGITTQSGKENVYLYIGEVLELNCTLNPSVRGNASDLTFDVRNDILVSHNKFILNVYMHFRRVSEDVVTNSC